MFPVPSFEHVYFLRRNRQICEIKEPSEPSSSWERLGDGQYGQQDYLMKHYSKKNVLTTETVRCTASSTSATGAKYIFAKLRTENCLCGPPTRSHQDLFVVRFPDNKFSHHFPKLMRRRGHPCLICHDRTRQTRPRCNHPCHKGCVAVWRTIRTDLPASACPVCDQGTPIHTPDIRYCLGCGIGIEKNGGCDWMQCEICYYQFNWEMAPLTQPSNPIYTPQEATTRQRTATIDLVFATFAMVLLWGIFAYLIYQREFTMDGQMLNLERNIDDSIQEADRMQQYILVLLERVREYETKIAALRVAAAT